MEDKDDSDIALYRASSSAIPDILENIRLLVSEDNGGLLMRRKLVDKTVTKVSLNVLDLLFT